MKASNIGIENNLEIQSIVNSLDEFIKEINYDRFCLTEGTISKAKFELWERVHEALKNKKGAQNFILGQKNELDIYFLRAVINMYISMLSKLKYIDNITRIALRVYNTTDVDVWIELKDDDEATEQEILLATASNNTKIQGLGYYFNLMLVEQSDELVIPQDFDEINLAELHSKP